MNDVKIVSMTLCKEEILELTHDDYITANVVIPFAYLINWDLDELNDYVSELLFNSYSFWDIGFKPIGVTEDGDIILQVTGNVSDVLREMEEEEIDLGEDED